MDDPSISWLDGGHDGPETDALAPCGGEIQSGCVWTVPLRPDGEPSDVNAVLISLRDATGHETALFRVAGPSECAGSALAWYVDAPEGGGPVQLVACPETCDLITATGQDVVLVPGCVNPHP